MLHKPLTQVTDRVRDAFPLLMLVLFFGGAMHGYSAPYFNLYLTENGFSGTLIGTLLSSAAFIELILIPTFSNLADRTHRHRILFQGLMLTFALACTAILIFPIRPVLFAGILVTQVNLRSTMVLGLQLAHTRYQQHGRDLLGVLRSIFALGFIVASMTSIGLLLSGSYTIVFIAAVCSSTLSLLLSRTMPESTSDESTPPGITPPRNTKLYLLLASQFFVTTGIRNGFAFWLVHFQENLGFTTSNIAVVVMLAASFEIPWFLYLDTAFKRYPSNYIYALGALFFGVVWIITGMVTNFWWVGVMLVLRGAAFGAWNLSSLFHVNEISRPQNVATNQALVQITVPGIASLLTGAPMGYVWDHFTPLIFFSVCAVFLIIGAGVMVFGTSWLNRKLADEATHAI